MEREKAALKEIAQAHEFEIISLGGGRLHMDLPQYREAAQRLEAVQEQVTAAEHDIAELEKQKKALQGTVRRLQAAEKVRVDLETVQPERTLTGAVRGVTVEQVEELKAAAIRGAAAEHDVLELKKENRQLHSQMPSIRERLKEAEERKKIERENQQLKSYTVVLEDELDKRGEAHRQAGGGSDRCPGLFGKALAGAAAPSPGEAEGAVRRAGDSNAQYGSAGAGTGAGARP